jgi:hypothetical protein
MVDLVHRGEVAGVERVIALLHEREQACGAAVGVGSGGHESSFLTSRRREQLVTDRDQLVQDELSRLIRTRASGTTPAAAIREFVLDTVEGIRRIPAGQWRGELGFLAAISPTVHRFALEMSDRQATALATALAETGTVPPEIARLRGIALAGVFQIIITEAGRRTREGQSQDQIADELRPAIEAVLNDLNRWLTPATK